MGKRIAPPRSPLRLLCLTPKIPVMVVLLLLGEDEDEVVVIPIQLRKSVFPPVPIFTPPAFTTPVRSTIKIS